jgi:hypothetical protein
LGTWKKLNLQTKGIENRKESQIKCIKENISNIKKDVVLERSGIQGQYLNKIKNKTKQTNTKNHCRA